MATNGVVNTSAYNGRYVALEWHCDAGNIASNTTRIHWTLKGAGGGGTWYKAGPFRAVIDGRTVFDGGGRINLANGTVIASGSLDLGHDAYGNKWFEISVQGAIVNYGFNVSGSGGFWLPQIPRKPVLNLRRMVSCDCNSAIFEYEVTQSYQNFTHLFFRLKKAGESYGNWGQAFGSPTFSIGGLESNTNYFIQVQGRNSDQSIIGDASNEISFWTQNIANPTKANNFNIENQNPSMEFFIPNNSTIKAWIETIDGIHKFQLKENATSPITFTLAEAEKNILYNSIPNSNAGNINYVLETTCNGKTYTFKKAAEMYVTNANPLFIDFDVENIDLTKTVSIVGKNEFISDYSNCKITITDLKKAVAQKGATIVKYNLFCGTKKSVINGITGSGIIQGVNSKTIQVVVEDSRQNKTTVTKEIVLYPYKPVVITKAETERINFVGENINLRMDGTYTNAFGNVANQITIEYQRKGSAAWKNATALFNVTNGTIKEKDVCELIGETFAFGTEDVIKIKISDLIDYVTVDVKVDSGKILMAMDRTKNVVSVGSIPPANANLQEGSLNIKNKLYIDGIDIFNLIYPVGSIYLSINNTNPSVLFGGRWEQIAKGRTLVGVDEADVDFNASNKIGGLKEHSHKYGIAFGEYYGTTTLLDGQAEHNVGIYDGETDNFEHPVLKYRTYIYTNSNHAAATKETDCSRYEAITNTTKTDSMQPFVTCYIWERKE